MAGILCSFPEDLQPSCRTAREVATAVRAIFTAFKDEAICRGIHKELGIGGPKPQVGNTPTTGLYAVRPVRATAASWWPSRHRWFCAR